MKPEIFAHLKTLDTFYELKTALIEAQARMYKTSKDGHIIESLKSSFPYLASAQLTEENIVEFTKELTALVNKAELVQITLAYEPSEELLTRIYEVIWAILKRPFLIQLTIKKDIIGGMFIELDGKQHDYTLIKLVREEAVPTTHV